MKFCYADPPYIGYSRYYPEKEEVDHHWLLSHLTENYDAWALSTHTPGLKIILSMPECPDNVRIGAWVKSFAAYNPGVNPAYAWEPVIAYGGRSLGNKQKVIDWVRAPIILRGGMIGMKPPLFCHWLFRFMGLVPTDEFTDMYPGSGIVSREWQKYCRQLEMVL